VKHRCKDCKAEDRQGKPLDAPYQGPRCYRHHLQWRSGQRELAAGKRRANTYGITPERYQALLAVQGGGCAICSRKPGKRRLAVDHDHSCCPGKTSCGYCVRGLLCWTCNKYLEHIRDDPEVMQRGANYMQDPPASGVALTDTIQVS
jgi:hypothetical protein